MILLEYEAKTLLAAYGVPVPRSFVIHDTSQESELQFPLMLKVQIPKGGRGKAGGVRKVEDTEGYQKTVGELLGSDMLGCHVDSLLAEECLTGERELYLSFVVDRTSKRLAILAQRQGGVDVERAAHDVSGDTLKLPLNGVPDDEAVQRLAEFYSLSNASQLKTILEGLYDVARQQDALLVEVNPLMVCSDGRLVCADAKVELDDAAAFRHKDWQFSQSAASSQFVVLDEQGMVASMANGAGLAMATVDAIQSAGLRPANFFDVGGGTNVEGMVNAFAKLVAMPRVQAIIVNIFGGITRCDEVAQAIIGAQQRLGGLPSLFVRLTGTNEVEGRRLLEEAAITPLASLADCVVAASRELESDRE